MSKPHLSSNGNGIYVLFSFFILFWPLISGASSAPISTRDLDDSDPVTFSSRIMQIDYVKDVLTVAESEVMVVDMVIGGKFFTTLLTGLYGEAISLESLNPGQRVAVQGLKLADGRVVASMVRQLE